MSEEERRREETGWHFVHDICNHCEEGGRPCQPDCAHLHSEIGIVVEERDALKATLKEVLEWVRVNKVVPMEVWHKAWELVKS